MKIYSTIMIAVGSLVVACSAWDWKPHGGYMWDKNCDFTGNSFLYQASTAKECGKHCIKNDGCTYMVHKEGICHLKDYGIGYTPDPNPGAYCGYVPSRILPSRRFYLS